MSTPNGGLKDHPVISWAPKIINVTPLGNLRDISGNYFPRDIGRSSLLSNGRVLVQFGDTFCHNAKGEFLGLTNNTCAIVVDKSNPTLLTYTLMGEEEKKKKKKKKEKKHKQDTERDCVSENRIPPLLQRFREERDTKPTADKPGVTYKLWSFSGIAEARCANCCVYGWTWFEKWKIEQVKDKPSREIFQYTGIASVVYRYKNEARRLHSYRHGTSLFSDQEPRFGAFCAVTYGTYILAYGHIGQAHDGESEKDVVLARVPRELAETREQYEFWDGHNWYKTFDHCTPVLRDMQHGQIFKTEMFSSSSKSKWAFIGCNATGDSQVIFGRSPNPGTPFTCVKLTSTVPLTRPPTGPFTYCMYVHPWAFDETKGDFMVTWSEPGENGSVVAVIIRLKTIKDSEEEDPPDELEVQLELVKEDEALQDTNKDNTADRLTGGVEGTEKENREDRMGTNTLKRIKRLLRN